MQERLTLASASPRRRELLAQLGIAFDITPSHVDEALFPGEHAAAYVERLARTKAQAIQASLVLAADTSVVVDDEVLGKPGADLALGAAMLRRLSGRAHQVMTGIAVSSRAQLLSSVIITEVRFRPLSEKEILWYVGTGEGADKAGGYALQGQAGAFITGVMGSPSNVIGLPLAETVELLRASGVRLPMDG